MSLKRVKMEDKLLWIVTMGTHQRSFERYHPDLLRPPLPQDCGSQPQPKTPIAIVSGTDFKFDRYIHRVHPNKSPLKFWRKESVDVSRDCPNILSTPFYLKNGQTGKATNFKFCTHIPSVNRNKSPLKISGKVAVGILRDSRKFSSTHV